MQSAKTLRLFYRGIDLGILDKKLGEWNKLGT